MKCKQIRENLTAYTANTLKDAEAEMLRQHLQTCTPCEVFRAELEHLDRVGDLWEEVDPTPAFPARFRAALQTQEVQSKSQSGLLGWLQRRWSAQPLGWPALATTALLVLAIAVSIFVARTSPTRPPRSVIDEIANNEQTPFEEFLTIKEEEDKLKDFDVIAHLDLLDHWDEIKNQIFKQDAQQGTN